MDSQDTRTGIGINRSNMMKVIFEMLAFAGLVTAVAIGVFNHNYAAAAFCIGLAIFIKLLAMGEERRR